MSQPATYLRSVVLRPKDRATMKRKARGNEVAGVVHACPACGWESAPCRTLAETRKAPHHECPTARFDGDQAAMVGPRFTHRETDGGTCR